MHNVQKKFGRKNECKSFIHNHLRRNIVMHFMQCAVKGVGFQWVRVPPGNWSLQPVAIGAAVEVTKPSKPSMERIAIGDSASKQAVT